MQNEDRKEIMEKRSSLRGWRERGGKMPIRVEVIGAALVGLIFLALIASSYWNAAIGNSPSQADLQNKNPAPVKISAASPVSLPAPSIKINSPENITYNTSMPPLDFIVAGSSLDTVLLSVDGSPDIIIPHDGTISRIDFARLYPLFIDDFSGTIKSRWKENGNWRMDGGKYITGGGTSFFGDKEWDDYFIEAKMRIISGNDVSIDVRRDGQSNYYRIQTSDAYSNLNLLKMDNKGYTTLFSTRISGINPASWHTWKVAVNGSKIQTLIDEIPYIEYTDSDRPYLKGNSSLRTVNTNVEYDYVHVYKPLSDGTHYLKLFANNIAGNSSFRVVYFTIDETTKAEEDIIGKIGVPLVKNGINITLKSITSSVQYMNIWISVKNIEDKEEPFKLGPGTVIMDNMGQQYENIKVARSAEISQTNLYPLAMREGAVFFERLAEGRSPKKLVLNVNGERFEFILDILN